MAHEVNPLHSVTLDVVENIKKLRLQARAAKPVQFGDVKMSRSEARDKIMQMNATQRAALRQKLGTEKVLDIIRGGQ